MKITEHVVGHIAELAKLKLTQTERSMLALDLEQIISYVDKLDELDVSNVEPMYHVVPINNVFREDKVEVSYPRQKLLENAPASEEGCFKVPMTVAKHSNG